MAAVSPNNGGSGSGSNVTTASGGSAVGPDSGGGGPAIVAGPFGQQGEDRLKALYPMVDENDTPLPRSWNSKDKFTNLGLSQNNIRVHYKGTFNDDGGGGGGDGYSTTKLCVVGPAAAVIVIRIACAGNKESADRCFVLRALVRRFRAYR